MTDDELDQLEAGLVRLRGGVCVASDIEVSAADAIAKLRAERDKLREQHGEAIAANMRRTYELAAERLKREMQDRNNAERDALRALLRETRIIVADEDRPRMDASELVARIDAALNQGDRDE